MTEKVIAPETTSTTTTAPRQALDKVEDSYNKAPYQSFPFSQSHPTHLYTLGALFGLNPPPVEEAKVLELGCAGGGNIIPLASHYPKMQIMGIDLSEVQIEDGIKQILDLNLKNIKLRHQSIMDFSDKDGQFDYIICHGVYSWVDDAARDKILSICQNNLSKNGIAYISYNTFPGWNMVNSVRDLMAWHTKHLTEPAKKAQQARSILKFITDGLAQDQSPYAACLRNEIELLSRQADSYLLHEHLSIHNSPVYFHQFMEQVTRHQLSYLSDAHIENMFTENLPPQFATELKKVTDIITSSQYMDFIRNQRFRSTLLCHQDQTVDRSLNTKDIEKFYLQLKGLPKKADLCENDLAVNHEIQFYNSLVTYKITTPLAKLAMLVLHEERNKPLHYKDLCEKIASRGSEKNIEVIKKTLNDDLNLMRAVLAGIIEISSYPKKHITTVQEKPKACELARYQAKKLTFVTNRRHQTVALTSVSAAILPHLDGEHDFEDLVKIVTQCVTDGKLSVLDVDKKPVADKEQIDKQIREGIAGELQSLANHGILI